MREWGDTDGPPAIADVYVRHAMPTPDPDLASDDWTLGPTGRAGAAELAMRLTVSTEVAEVVASPSPKALHTAEPLAARFERSVTVDDRLLEVRRPFVGSDYRAVAHRYLEGAQPDGWEPREDVAARVGAAVRDARVRAHRAHDGAVVIVGHGLALSLHLEAVLPKGFDACGFWSRLAFPDAWHVDPVDLVLSRSIDRG